MSSKLTLIGTFASANEYLLFLTNCTNLYDTIIFIAAHINHPVLIVIQHKKKSFGHNFLHVYLIPEPVHISLVAEQAIHHGLLEYVAHSCIELVIVLSCYVPVTSKGAEWNEGRGGECSIISIYNVRWVVAYLTDVSSICK